MIIVIIPIPEPTTTIHINHFKTTFMCPRSIAGMPFRLWRSASGLPFYCAPLVCVPDVCMCAWCNWIASCVAARQTENQKPRVPHAYARIGLGALSRWLLSRPTVLGPDHGLDFHSANRKTVRGGIVVTGGGMIVLSCSNLLKNNMQSIVSC